MCTFSVLVSTTSFATRPPTTSTSTHTSLSSSTTTNTTTTTTQETSRTTSETVIVTSAPGQITIEREVGFEFSISNLAYVAALGNKGTLSYKILERDMLDFVRINLYMIYYLLIDTKRFEHIQ